MAFNRTLTPIILKIQEGKVVTKMPSTLISQSQKDRLPCPTDQGIPTKPPQELVSFSKPLLLSKFRFFGESTG